MTKILIALFLVLISVDYLAGKSIEESSANEETSEILEKSELFPADVSSLERTADDVGANEEISKSAAIEKLEDSPNTQDILEKRAEKEDLSDLAEARDALKEKSDDNAEANERKAEEIEKTNGESKSAEALKEKNRSSENTDKQFEQLPEISKSATEIEEKKAEDHLEASVESKLSDNGMTSSTIHESDRSESKSGELKEQQDKQAVDETTATRRMLSKPNFVSDKKSRSGESRSLVAPEDKTAHNPAINAYVNSEFGSGSNKLIDRAHVSIQNNGIKPSQPMTDPHISLKSPTPETGNLQNHQIHQQKNVPQLYPQSKLHLDFPVFNLQQHEPRGVPIYLELERDQEKLKNNVFGAQSVQISPGANQFHPSQNNMDTRRSPIKKQFRNIEHDISSQDPQFHQNRRLINLNTDAENRYVENLYHNPRNRQQSFQTPGRMNIKTSLESNPYDNVSQDSRIQIPLFQQNRLIPPAIFPIDFKTSSENVHSENLSHVPRNQVQLIQNPGKVTLQAKQSTNLNNEQMSRFQRNYHAQKAIDPNMSSENKAFQNLSQKKHANHYPNTQLFKNKVPASNYDQSSENFKTIFQILADATGRPKKIANHLQNTVMKQIYPNLFNPNSGGYYPHDHNYLLKFRI